MVGPRVCGVSWAVASGELELLSALVGVLSVAVCGLAGAMMTTLDGQLSPGTYQPLRFTFLVWVMVIVGVAALFVALSRTPSSVSDPASPTASTSTGADIETKPADESVIRLLDGMKVGEQLEQLVLYAGGKVGDRVIMVHEGMAPYQVFQVPTLQLNVLFFLLRVVDLQGDQDPNNHEYDLAYRIP